MTATRIPRDTRPQASNEDANVLWLEAIDEVPEYMCGELVSAASASALLLALHLEESFLCWQFTMLPMLCGIDGRLLDQSEKSLPF